MANDFRLPASHSRLTAVMLREWTRMTSRRLYFGTCIVLPLFTLFFMATIFGNGQMENIPIGIVDQDNTATSRTIVRNLSAVPTFKVTRHFVNEAAAREAVQRKEIYGYLSIPPRFEQDAITDKDATLSYYYHYARRTFLGRRRTDGSFRNFTGTGRFIAHSHAGSGIRSKRTADRDIPFACTGQ